MTTNHIDLTLDIGFINPAKISRVTVYPPVEGVAETALPADLLKCVRP